MNAMQEAQAAYEYAYRDFGARIAALETELVRTSAPIIDEFMRKLIDLHELTRQVSPTTVEIARKTARDGTARITFKTDRPSIEARLKAIIEARRTAESWKLDADQSDLRARLESLIDNLPVGEGNFVEITP